MNQTDLPVYSDLPIHVQRELATYNAAVYLAVEPLARLTNTDVLTAFRQIDDVSTKYVEKMTDDQIRELVEKLDSTRIRRVDAARSIATFDPMPEVVFAAQSLGIQRDIASTTRPWFQRCEAWSK